MNLKDELLSIQALLRDVYGGFTLWVVAGLLCDSPNQPLHSLQPSLTLPEPPAENKTKQDTHTQRDRYIYIYIHTHAESQTRKVLNLHKPTRKPHNRAAWRALG